MGYVHNIPVDVYHALLRAKIILYTEVQMISCIEIYIYLNAIIEVDLNVSKIGNRESLEMECHQTGLFTRLSYGLVFLLLQTKSKDSVVILTLIQFTSCF